MSKLGYLGLGLSLAAELLSGEGKAVADILTVGGGGKYVQTELPNDSTGKTSVYRGPGFRLEAKMQFSKAKSVGELSSSSFGFDVFGFYESTQSTNISAADTFNSSAFGAGADARVQWWFLGLEYGKSQATLAVPGGSSLDLSYGLFGARTGAVISLGSSFQVQLGGFYNFGAAYPAGNPLTSTQVIRTWGGILMLQYRILSNDDPFVSSSSGP